MLTTAEMRWFFSGPLPASDSNFPYASWGPPEQRTDAYLSMAPSDAVGVKFRDGRFEIKARVGAPEIVELSPRASGVVEHWCKWSVRGPMLEPLIAKLTDDEHLVSVEKRRWSLTYGAGGGSLQVVARRNRPAEGVTVEVAALHSREQDWWSIGIEAFGGLDSDRRGLVEAAARLIEQRQPAATLRPDNSYAYPAWLARGPSLAASAKAG